MKSRYDVLVVGGGPAGLTAAQAAAARGADVLLVETHREIGKPLLCAEGVSLGGLSLTIEPDDSWICSRVTGARLFAPSGRSVYVDHPNAGFMIDRTKFEPFLANLAMDAGAEVVTGCRADNPSASNCHFNVIELVRNGGSSQVEFGVLIAADGVESVVARKAGLVGPVLPSHLATCAQYRLEGIEIDPTVPEIHFDFRIAPGGYMWVFPKGSASANVGLGLVPTMGKGMDPFRQLKIFLDKRFGKYKVTGRAMGIVPVFEGRKTMVRGNVLAVGDAARLLDSLTGAGIVTALHSGMLAGRAAVEYLDKGRSQSALADYPRKFMRVFGRKLRMYSLAHNVFLHMSSEDMEKIIGIANELLGDRIVRSIDTVGVIRQILARRPSLLRHVPKVIWK
jgi:digeranylgeranylglycerophospholipid reductase